MKIKNYLLISTLAAIYLSPIAFADNYQIQLDAQQRTMLSMQNRMMQMENELKKIQGQIDELNYKLQKQSSAQNQTVSNHIQTSNTQNLSVTDANKEQTQTPSSESNTNIPTDKLDSLKDVDAMAQEQYDKAYALIIDNKLQDAVNAFGSYLDTYKDNKLTPNAWYWKGQAQYKLKDYNNARVSFLNVVRFESSQKRPDSLYKLGMISKLNGDAQKSMKYFELVIKTYPNDTAANFAKKELGI